MKVFPASRDQARQDGKEKANRQEHPSKSEARATSLPCHGHGNESECSTVLSRKDAEGAASEERFAPHRNGVERPSPTERIRNDELQKPEGRNREKERVSELHAENGPVRLGDPESGGDDLWRGEKSGEKERGGKFDCRRLLSGWLDLENDPEHRTKDRQPDGEDVGSQQIEG